MNRKVAEQLLPLVNDPYFQGSIEVYVGDRIESLHTSLENELDTARIFRLQGQIMELKQLLSLKERLGREKDRHG